MGWNIKPFLAPVQKESVPITSPTDNPHLKKQKTKVELYIYRGPQSTQIIEFLLPSRDQPPTPIAVSYIYQFLN